MSDYEPGILGWSRGCSRLELRVVGCGEDGEEAACGSDMVDGEALAHVGQVISAAARIRALMRAQDQPQLVALQKLLRHERIGMKEAAQSVWALRPGMDAQVDAADKTPCGSQIGRERQQTFDDSPVTKHNLHRWLLLDCRLQEG